MSRKSRIQGKPHNISKNELVNGMVVTFSYASSSSDKNPLVLFLYEENNLMHCINLNYLPTESSVQELFNEINKSTSITVGDNLNVGSSHTLVGLHHKKTPGELNPKVLYENYLKNNFLKKYSNCYRTYNKSKVGVFIATQPDHLTISERASHIIINKPDQTYKFLYAVTESLATVGTTAQHGEELWYTASAVAGDANGGPIRLDIQPIAWATCGSAGTQGNVTFVLRKTV